MKLFSQWNSRKGWSQNFFVSKSGVTQYIFTHAKKLSIRCGTLGLTLLNAGLIPVYIMHVLIHSMNLRWDNLKGTNALKLSITTLESSDWKISNQYDTSVIIYRLKMFLRLVTDELALVLACEIMLILPQSFAVI